MIATVAALLLGAVVIALHNLDHPAVKRRIVALARSAAGVDLDYERAEGKLWSGLTIVGLTIQTPQKLATYAPKLLRIGAIDVTWGLWRVVSEVERVDSISVRDVDLAIIFDQTGQTSFSFDGPVAETAPAPATAPPRPLSRLLEGFLRTPLPVRRVTIDPLHTTIYRTEKGKILETIEVEGLRALLETARGKTGTRLGLTIGTAEAPLDVTLRRTVKKDEKLRARFWLNASAEPELATVALEARLVEQSFLPASKMPRKLDRLVALSVATHFDPDKQRVVMQLPNLDIVDGAVTATAALEQPDAATALPLVTRLEAKIDVPRLLRAVPPEWAEGLPHIGGGKAEASIERLQLAPVPYLLSDGKLRLKGKLSEVRHAQGGIELALESVGFDVSAGADRALRGRVNVDLDAVSVRPGIKAGPGSLALTADGVTWAGGAPHGRVGVTAHLTDASWAGATAAVAAHEVELEGATTLVDHPPYGGKLKLKVAALSVKRGSAPIVADSAELALDLQSLVPNAAHILRSEAIGKVSAALGGTRLVVDLKKRRDDVEYTLALDAPSLALVSAWVPDRPTLQIGWDKTGATVRSTGAVTGLTGGLTVRHDSSVELLHPVLRSRAGRIALAAVRAHAATKGTVHRHEGELTLALLGVDRDGTKLGDGQLGATLRFDAAAPLLAVRLKGQGDAAPDVRLDADVGFVRPTRQLTFAVDVGLGRLGALAPLVAALPALQGFSLPGLEVAVKGKGQLSGVVDAVHADGLPTFAASPLDRLTGSADFEVTAKGVKWHRQDRALDAPALVWKGTLTATPERRTAKSELALDALHVAFGPRRLDFAALHDDLEVALLGEPRLGQVEVKDRLTLGAVGQEVVPYYPMQNLALTLEASRNKDGVIRVSTLRLHNRGAGTLLTLRGGLDLGEDRRSLALRGSLEQELATAWTDKQRFVGAGKLVTEVQINSGDLRLYRLKSSVKVKDGSLELPQAKIKLTTVDGEIPIVADMMLTANGPRFVREVTSNNYADLRFSDQHPLAKQYSYLTIARIDTPWATIAPFAGNLEIHHNVVAMSQLELGVRSGRVSGRCAIDLKGRDSTMELTLRASGVRSSQGEPFDGNTSLEVSVRQRSVTGRAEILRIGRRHLLDLLDTVDPPRTDAAVNKVRRALALGYPDQVRIGFQRGFASARLTFGGLAKLVRLDEIRGIPMGPIIDRVLEPIFDAEDEDEE